MTPFREVEVAPAEAEQLAANHFATLVEGKEQLRELGRLTLWEGAQPISLRELG